MKKEERKLIQIMKVPEIEYFGRRDDPAKKQYMDQIKRLTEQQERLYPFADVGLERRGNFLYVVLRYDARAEEIVFRFLDAAKSVIKLNQAGRSSRVRTIKV